MFRITRLLTVMLALAIFLGTQTGAAAPGHRRSRGFASRSHTRAHESVGARYHAPPPESYDAGWYYPQMYPKYYAGFHGREMQIHGYPFGSEGFRGTAW